MNLAERLRARAFNARARMLIAWGKGDEVATYAYFNLSDRARHLADRREARRIAAGDPAYVRGKR